MRAPVVAGRVLALGVLTVTTLAACGGAPDDLADASAPRGPAGGRLVFDASMLEDPIDAWVPPVPDAGGSRDAGPPPDAGGERTCTGLSTSCSSIGAISCTSQRGCRVDGECTGSARSCYSIFDSYTCYSQDGCYWSSSGRDCGGSASSCRTYSFRSSCTSQDGCRWEDRCDGVATPCSLLAEWECELQRGCVLR